MSVALIGSRIASNVRTQVAGAAGAAGPRSTERGLCGAASAVTASVADPVPGDATHPSGVRQYPDQAVNKGKKPKLYKGREPIYPRRVHGRFRTLKWVIMALSLTIYYATPWIRFDRGPYAPDQAVLVDLANRRFYFLWIEIWPQEFFYVAGLLIMAGIGLFLVTSAVGRAWCGYACPQTVWTDLFIWIERLVIGDRNARIKLDQSPFSARKARLKITVHAIWLVIAVATGGAWIFYFADAPTLLGQFVRGQAPATAYVTVAVLTFTTYTLGGLMREQVCTYMCPWPRIQAAMMDEKSLTVTYNDWRGEPRSRHAKRMEREGKAVGDCIDCNACVAVCPTGIDIRDGQQLPCITCALCIDACDDVMTKIGKPRGLISYTTLQDFAANTARAAAEGMEAAKASQVLPGWREVMRPRVFVYFVLWSAIGIAMVIAVLARDRLDLSVAHDRNPRFVQLSDGSVRNGYTVKIMNMEPEPREFDFGLEGLPGGLMWSPNIVEEPARRFAVPVGPDQVREFRVFVKADPMDLAGDTVPFTFRTFDIGGREKTATETVFDTPERD
ncbi:cytochrome c oxidase accessory protein CcoG [Acuticoccus sp. I52.16.1]|uniref:cytochrome c oxidase accessory protein CcoG n=1 Tax=Acuticoccus sp. I52.16.1 TaxID=2928472 RepID=UPI001FD412A8|nr:cytochrome c oxidase accessory protein CcoG [Acuticoccus sp. I52.16.1]UOM34041.1 cytochrome c oxidase accessory protein CcoG [Acuticoccus sp. I52.16.1]